MAKKDLSIADILLAANLKITNTQSDPAISAALAGFGYDSAKMEQGKALYDNANQLFQQQKTEYGEQFAASEELKTKWDAADGVYMKHVKVSRVALQQNHGAVLKLGLNGARKRTNSNLACIF